MGRNHTGLKVDTLDRLFVAGGASKGIYVYDARTGADVASFALPDAGFVNDVVLTRQRRLLHRLTRAPALPLGIRRSGEPHGTTAG